MPTSFSQKGATPQQPPSVFGPTSGSTTPVAKALSNASSPSFNFATTPAAPQYNVQSNTQGQATATPAAPNFGAINSTPNAGLLAAFGNPAVKQISFHPPADTAQVSQAGSQQNASTGGLVNPNASFQSNVGGAAGTPIQQNQGSYPGFINQLNTQAANPSAATNLGLSTAGKTAQQIADIQGQLAESRKNEAQTLGDIRRNPIPLQFQQGQAGVTQTQYQQQQDALAQEISGLSNLYAPGLNAAVTGQQQQIGAANYGASATAPQLGQSGQQYYFPLQPGTSGGVSLPPQAQDYVNSLAQQVRNGQMTRGDAESRLQTYGVAGLQALNTALGSGFNTNASNASAATTATGQQIQAAIVPANQALDALQTAYNSLSGLQQGNVLVANVPLVSQIAQNASMALGPGRDTASAFQGALQEARSRIDAALVGSIGVNAAAAQASALLPDNMLPSEIPQKIAAAKYYLQNQLASYSGSGQQPTQNLGNGMSSGLTWDTI